MRPEPRTRTRNPWLLSPRFAGDYPCCERDCALFDAFPEAPCHPAVTSLGVVRHADGWTIVVSGRRWGRFAYKVDAEEAALRLARRMAQSGEQVEVMVQERWGEMRSLRIPEGV